MIYEEKTGENTSSCSVCTQISSPECIQSFIHLALGAYITHNAHVTGGSLPLYMQLLLEPQRCFTLLLYMQQSHCCPCSLDWAADCLCLLQKGCTNLLKGDTRASRANMTEHSYKKIFCSNMMKANQDLIKDGLTDQMADIFMENSECLLGAGSRLLSSALSKHSDLRCRILNNVEKWRSSKMFFDLRSSALHQQSWCVEWPVSPISTKLIGCSKSSGGRMRKWAALGETVSVWTAR